jgi:vitamin B12 transporter
MKLIVEAMSRFVSGATLAAGSIVLGLPAAIARAQSQTPAVPPDEIIVTSSLVPQPKREIGTAVSVLDFGEMQLRGYTEVADVLRTQPGISVSNSGGVGKSTSVRVRGEESYRTTLIIDGVRAADASAPQVSPDFGSLLATSDFDRIEVLRGPQGFMYGADAGGVVNIITKRGAGELGGRVGLEYGEYSTRKLDAAVSGGGDHGDYYVSVTDLNTDGFNARSDDTVLADADGAKNTTVHTKLGWNVSDELRLQLVARHIDASTMYDGCFSTTTFALVNDCSATTDQTTYRLSADYDSDEFRNTFAYSNVDVARDNLSAGVSAFKTEGETGRLEYTGSYRPFETLTLVYGVDLEQEKLIGSPEPFERRQNGYYFEYDGAFSNRFFLTVGARYDDNDDFGQHTSSRVTGAYLQDLGDGRSLKYRASYGTGFRAPSLYEISYNASPFAFPPAAGLRLSEETSKGYDLGVEYDTKLGLHVEMTYFDQDIHDEIYFDSVGFSGYLQRAGASSASKGFEVAAEVPLGAGLRLLANWTDNDAKDLTGEPRLRRPKDLANIGLKYQARSQRLELMANYRLARDAVDVGGARLEDYDVVDVSASYSLSDRFEIYGRIENATGESYQEVAGYNTAGRSIYGGVRVHF